MVALDQHGQSLYVRQVELGNGCRPGHEQVQAGGCIWAPVFSILMNSTNLLKNRCEPFPDKLHIVSVLFYLVDHRFDIRVIAVADIVK